MVHYTQYYQRKTNEIDSVFSQGNTQAERKEIFGGVSSGKGLT
jgi:hypothetical protein